MNSKKKLRIGVFSFILFLIVPPLSAQRVAPPGEPPPLLKDIATQRLIRAYLSDMEDNYLNTTPPDNDGYINTLTIRKGQIDTYLEGTILSPEEMKLWFGIRKIISDVMIDRQSARIENLYVRLGEVTQKLDGVEAAMKNYMELFKEALAPILVNVEETGKSFEQIKTDFDAYVNVVDYQKNLLMELTDLPSPKDTSTTILAGFGFSNGLTSAPYPRVSLGYISSINSISLGILMDFEINTSNSTPFSVGGSILAGWKF